MLGGIPVLRAQATTVPAPEPHVYGPLEVDVQAKVIDDGIGPHYPDALRPLGLGATVIAQFIIDTAGHADTTSVQTEGSTQPLFIAAVHEALTRMHFTPAQKGGEKVFAEVVESFTFRADVPAPVNADSVLVASAANLRSGPAQYAQGSIQPAYPEAARKAGYSAVVTTEFVIDSTGRAIANTFKVVLVRAWLSNPPPPHNPRAGLDLGFGSPEDAFVTAVSRALPSMRFVPAEVHGRKVAQLVQMPFTFTLTP